MQLQRGLLRAAGSISGSQASGQKLEGAWPTPAPNDSAVLSGSEIKKMSADDGGSELPRTRREPERLQVMGILIEKCSLSQRGQCL